MSSYIAYGSNLHTTSDFGSCVATRRAALYAAMLNHENTLSAISLDAINHGKESLEAAKQRLHEAQNQLNSIPNDSLDNLPITLQLLTALGINFKINTFNDLAVVNHLSQEEIISLLNQQDLQAQVLTVLSPINNLIIFLYRTHIRP